MGPLPSPPPPICLLPVPSASILAPPMKMEQLPKGAEAKLVVDWELLGWSWGEVLVILGSGSTGGGLVAVWPLWRFWEGGGTGASRVSFQ